MDTLVIPAGGRGLRLKERFGDLPKAMVPIAGKPLLDHQIEWAKANGIGQVFILAGWRGEIINNHFINHRHGINIQVILDHRLVGTAGTVLRAILDGSLPAQFALLYGDLIINAPLRPLLDFHSRMCADVSLFLHPTDHPQDSDLVEIEDGWIRRFYRDRVSTDSKFSSAGLHIINRSALNPYRLLKFPIDIGKDLFPQMLDDGARLAGHIGEGYIKDIGTPERYDQVCADLATTAK